MQQRYLGDGIKGFKAVSKLKFHAFKEYEYVNLVIYRSKVLDFYNKYVLGANVKILLLVKELYTNGGLS